MTLFYYKKSIIALVAIIGSHIVYHCITRKKKEKEPKKFNDLVIFSETSQKTMTNYGMTESLVSLGKDRILFYLNESRYSLDICMQRLTDQDIIYMIYLLKFRGVRIRLIMDFPAHFFSMPLARRLQSANPIAIRWKGMYNTEKIMHHKFCVVNASAENNKMAPFIMTGSLSWTKQATGANWESVIVMSDPILVRKHKEEFEKLWDEFTPAFL